MDMQVVYERSDDFDSNSGLRMDTFEKMMEQYPAKKESSHNATTLPKRSLSVTFLHLTSFS